MQSTDVTSNDHRTPDASHPAPLNVQIVLFDGFDLLDAIAPYEVFLAAGDISAVPVHVELVSVDGARAVPCGVSGLRIPASAALVPRRGGIVLVPGAAGKLDGDGPDTVPQLLLRAAQTQLASAMREALDDPDVVVATVCGGSLILGMSNLLVGRHATTHHMGVELLSASGAFPVSGRVVDDGDLVTGGGVTSGLDVALYLLERELGADVALGVEKLLEYERRGTVWRHSPGNSSLPALTARELPAAAPPPAQDPADQSAASRFTGAWNVELKTPIGALQVVLQISLQNGTLQGWATQGDETVPFENLSLQSGCLCWTQQVTKPMRLTLKFSVTVDADAMTGTAKAGMLPASKLAGHRIVEANA